MVHGLQRSYEVLDINGNGSMRVYLKLEGKEDINAFAEDASLLMIYVTEHTNFFKKHTGTLGFYFGEEKEKIRMPLTFGRQFDDYFYSEKVAETVLEKYERARK